MRAGGYSLVEVLVASAILAVGLAAASLLMNTLVIQQETEGGAVRAANLQEQTTMLYRLGVTNAQVIYGLLPENCGSSAAPAVNNYSITFGVTSQTAATAALSGGGFADVVYQVTPCTIIYGSAAGPAGQVAYSSSTVAIVRPAIRVGP